MRKYLISSFVLVFIAVLISGCASERIGVAKPQLIPVDTPSVMHCQSDANCGTNRKCINSQCVMMFLQCQTDEQCGMYKKCVDNLCVPVVYQCQTDAHCGPNEVCVNNLCVRLMEPPCFSTCPGEGLAYCSGQRTLRVCRKMEDAPCTHWVDESCPAHQICSSETHSCDCDNPCEPGTSECTNLGSITIFRLCARDSIGCAYWKPGIHSPCGEDSQCMSDSSCKECTAFWNEERQLYEIQCNSLYGACFYTWNEEQGDFDLFCTPGNEPCRQCTPGQKQCDGTSHIKECVEQDGCWIWKSMPCGYHKACVETGGTAACIGW